MLFLEKVFDKEYSWHIVIRICHLYENTRLLFTLFVVNEIVSYCHFVCDSENK